MNPHAFCLFFSSCPEASSSRCLKSKPSKESSVELRLAYSVLQKGRIQILKKEQGNREQATGNRFDAVVYENENRYKLKLLDYAEVNPA